MKLRKEDLPIALELPVATFRVAEWDDNSVAYVKMAAGADATPLLEGLKDDKCQCPHWGYMLEGAIHVKYNDGTEEVCKAGEMFYWPAGHTVWVEEDTSFVEFSPKKELKHLYDHIGDKLAAAAQ
ncbi:MAG: cupin domain-containing protein [Candidatus Zixiibacteriota bacterium]|nr:MAG: cupin domain-containing protein [candidate division Zixibacteria bacterium]HHI03747.1 cupin domain-containing protein [candidate division Zixibacteria bacterium]